MNRKFYFITLAVTLVIAAGIAFAFVYYGNKDKQATVTEKPTHIGENYTLLPIEELSKKDKLKIGTEKGTIEINNVYKNPLERLSDNGVSFAKSNDYFMDFYPEDNGFLIIIYNPDIVSAEAKAEKDFLKTLGITQEQACKLKVSITVPYSVSEKYSGGVYGFSFCPNATHIQ